MQRSDWNATCSQSRRRHSPRDASPFTIAAILFGESPQFGIGKIGENNDRQVVVNVSNQQRFKPLPRAVMIMNIFSTLSLQLPCKSIRAFPTV